EAIGASVIIQLLDPEIDAQRCDLCNRCERLERAPAAEGGAPVEGDDRVIDVLRESGRVSNRCVKRREENERGVQIGERHFGPPSSMVKIARTLVLCLLLLVWLRHT